MAERIGFAAIVSLVASSKPEALPRVIYITSRGHSGSTITELMIGAHSQVFAGGELKEIGRGRRIQRCRCRIQPAAECPFWSQVDSWLRERNHPALLELRLDDPDDEVFIAHNRALFLAIADVSGSEIILDSSKTLERVNRLVDCGKFDIGLVYLRRSPFGVVYSHVRRGRSLEEHCRQITVGTMKARKRLAGRPHASLRYEDLTRDPEAEIRRLTTNLGLPFEASQLRWAENPGHSFAGNKSRFAEDSTIRRDASWRRGLSPMQLLQIAWLTLPTRFESPWLYEAHMPYWKGEGLQAWRVYRRGWKQNARRRRRHDFIARFPGLRPIHRRLKGLWGRIRGRTT